MYQLTLFPKAWAGHGSSIAAASDGRGTHRPRRGRPKRVSDPMWIWSFIDPGEKLFNEFRAAGILRPLVPRP
jgi:hypothetical protein